jgi:hypothetical protein
VDSLFSLYRKVLDGSDRGWWRLKSPSTRVGRSEALKARPGRKAWSGFHGVLYKLSTLKEEGPLVRESPTIDAEPKVITEKQTPAAKSFCK